MNNVKNSLASLCCHLNFLFDFNFTTEDFRLAKFNKNERGTVFKFWRLLNVLTLNDKSLNSNKIKDFLQSINYKNPGIYSLSDSLDQGSRELLIAVGFVLSEGLEKAIEQEIKRSPFDAGFEMLQEERDHMPTPNFSNFTCERDFQRYTDWLKTRVILNSREISELQIQNRKILERLKNSFPRLQGYTVNEILALNCEKYAKKFMNHTEKITHILINHQDWTKNESVFWQWMVSVLPSSTEGEKNSRTRKMSFANKTKKNK